MDDVEIIKEYNKEEFMGENLKTVIYSVRFRTVERITDILRELSNVSYGYLPNSHEIIAVEILNEEEEKETKIPNISELIDDVYEQVNKKFFEKK